MKKTMRGVVHGGHDGFMEEESDWTVGYFDEPYTELHPFPGQAQTDVEIDALTRLLPPMPARVLDVGCGPGRHVIGLSRRGFDVVGIDTSVAFLGAGRAEAHLLGGAEFVEQDMRALSYENEFDGAVSLQTAWGYFDDETNEDVLRRIARALHRGGTFIIDVMSRDGLMRIFSAKDWVRLTDGTSVTIERAFDPVAGVVIVANRWKTPAGQDVERSHRLRVYTATELAAMLQRVGLTPTAWYEGFSLELLTYQSRRLLVSARRA